MGQLFTADEIARYEALVRPVVERGTGIRREAVAFLVASKPATAEPAS
jgi:hypothetical protein